MSELKSFLENVNVVEKRNHECKYCGRSFTSERTLSVHMCEQKRRHMMQGEKWVQLGYRAFQRFYEKATKTKEPKTFEEFANSKYYTAFTKFGKFSYDLQVLNFVDFVDFLIDFGVKLDDWTKDEAYVLWIKQYVRKESYDVALERSIKFMEKWSRNTHNHWTDFFVLAKDNELAYWIQTGRVSPWVVFACESGKERLGKFQGDHLKIVLDMISPRFWTERFDKNPEDVQALTDILKEAGL